MFDALIIKSSHSKLPDGSLKSNLGDVLRCTVILNCLSDNYLWLSDTEGIKILEHFILPEKLQVIESIDTIATPILAKTVYNLDNFASVDNLRRLSSVQIRGYLPHGEGMRAENELLDAITPYTKSPSQLSWQQALIEGLQFPWRQQDYVPPLQQVEATIDIGLNWKTHPSWPSKQWPLSAWKELEHLLSPTYSVSWQRETNSIEEYLQWLSQCKVIISCDSFGLHAASALRRGVIALIGPTREQEFHYNRVFSVKPPARPCMPCVSPICTATTHCMPEVNPHEVAVLVRQMKQLRSQDS